MVCLCISEDVFEVAWIVALSIVGAIILWFLTLPIHAAGPRCAQYICAKFIRWIRCKSLKPFSYTPICEKGATLLLGSMPRKRENVEELLDTYKKLAIVSLNAEWEIVTGGLPHEAELKTLGVELLRLPTPDYFPVQQRDISAAISFIEGKLAAGVSVLVHCNAGKGRSAMVVICAVAKFLQVDVRAAYAHVRARRKIARLTKLWGTRPQWRSCVKFVQQLRIKPERDVEVGSWALDRPAPAQGTSARVAPLAAEDETLAKYAAPPETAPTELS